MLQANFMLQIQSDIINFIQKSNIRLDDSFSVHNFPIYNEGQTLCQHRFWYFHEYWLILTIQTIPHKLQYKLASLYCGLRPILVYPNP